MTVRCQKRGCEQTLFLSHLHGDKGGPLMCVPCRLNWDKHDAENRAQASVFKRALHGDDQAYRRPEITYLTAELLQDILVLVHPDHQPRERAEIAQRVTSELLTLKPFIPPKPKPKPAPATAMCQVPQQPDAKPLRINYPCSRCYATVPFFYCDMCRKKWDEIRQKERDWAALQQRKRRARRKAMRPPATCTTCHTKFKGKRRDARFCSDACRQKAHRVTTNRPFLDGALPTCDSVEGAQP
jgi:hypothetical protein